MIQIKGVQKQPFIYLLVDSDEGLNVKTKQAIPSLLSDHENQQTI